MLSWVLATVGFVNMYVIMDTSFLYIPVSTSKQQNEHGKNMLQLLIWTIARKKTTVQTQCLLFCILSARYYSRQQCQCTNAICGISFCAFIPCCAKLHDRHTLQPTQLHDSLRELAHLKIYPIAWIVKASVLHCKPHPATTSQWNTHMYLQYLGREQS